MTQLPGPQETTSAKTLIAITAGVVGAVLLIISIASIAAMLSMGPLADDRAQGPRTLNSESNGEVPESGDSENIESEPGKQESVNFFDAWSSKALMNGSVEPS